MTVNPYANLYTLLADSTDFGTTILPPFWNASWYGAQDHRDTSVRRRGNASYKWDPGMTMRDWGLRGNSAYYASAKWHTMSFALCVGDGTNQYPSQHQQIHTNSCGVDGDSWGTDLGLAISPDGRLEVWSKLLWSYSDREKWGETSAGVLSGSGIWDYVEFYNRVESSPGAEDGEWIVRVFHPTVSDDKNYVLTEEVSGTYPYINDLTQPTIVLGNKDHLYTGESISDVKINIDDINTYGGPDTIPTPMRLLGDTWVDGKAWEYDRTGVSEDWSVYPGSTNPSYVLSDISGSSYGNPDDDTSYVSATDAQVGAEIGGRFVVPGPTSFDVDRDIWCIWFALRAKVDAVSSGSCELAIYAKRDGTTWYHAGVLRPTTSYSYGNATYGIIGDPLDSGGPWTLDNFNNTEFGFYVKKMDSPTTWVRVTQMMVHVVQPPVHTPYPQAHSYARLIG